MVALRTLRRRPSRPLEADPAEPFAPPEPAEDPVVPDRERPLVAPPTPDVAPVPRAPAAPLSLAACERLPVELRPVRARSRAARARSGSARQGSAAGGPEGLVEAAREPALPRV